MRTWCSRLILVVASLLIATAMAEVGFRLARNDPWYDRLTAEQTRHPPQRHQIGGREFKLRGPLTEAPKRSGTYRILFLGDSFTYGSGVVDPSKVFPSLVADRLNGESGLGSVVYEVFNGGIPGSLTTGWLELFRVVIDRFDPDLVVPVFFLRDGTSGIGSRRNIRQIGEGIAKLSERSWAFRNSATYRYFKERQAQREFSRDYLAEMSAAYLGDAEQTREWHRAQKNLLQMRNETIGREARFALIIFPVLFALGPDYPLRDVCQEIEDFAGEHDIPVHSLLPVFLDERASALWVSPLNQHPNERAHLIAAEAIAEFLAPLTSRARIK